MIGNEHPISPPRSSEERGGSSVLPSPNISGQVLENRKGFRIVLESHIRTLILYLSHMMNLLNFAKLSWKTNTQYYTIFLGGEFSVFCAV